MLKFRGSSQPLDPPAPKTTIMKTFSRTKLSTGKGIAIAVQWCFFESKESQYFWPLPVFRVHVLLFFLKSAAQISHSMQYAHPLPCAHMRAHVSAAHRYHPRRGLRIT